MSLLLCHDHRFFVAQDGEFYSYGQFDRRVLDRYVRVFGSVTIAARAQPLPASGDISNLSPCASEAVRFIEIPNLSSPRGLTFGRPAATRRLRQAIEEHDVVIARLPSEIGLLALSIARKRGKPTGAEVVACAWDGLKSHGSKTAALYAPVAWWRMRRAIARTVQVLYVTNDFLQRRYPAKGLQAVASNVEIEDTRQDVLEHRLTRIDKQTHAPVFGMIAALFHKEKGIDIALKAFAAVKPVLPGARLKVLGPGDPGPWVALAANLGVKDDVTFCGTLPRGAAVMKWLDDIDIYIQTSFQEGLPRALIEAMSRGCPALASSVGGTPELLPYATLHKPGDATALAKQMASAPDAKWQKAESVRNFEASKRYGKRHLDLVRENFWRVLAQSG